jgi:hypothetical protein
MSPKLDNRKGSQCSNSENPFDSIQLVQSSIRPNNKCLENCSPDFKNNKKKNVDIGFSAHGALMEKRSSDTVKVK